VSPLQALKLWLAEHVGLGKDALHIYVALTLYFGSIALLGWRADGWKPLALVGAAALAGEAWDMRDRVADGIAQNYAGNLHDLWNTMFWPLAVALLVRSGRLRLSGRNRGE
jgi:hypothetical protein